MSKAPQQGPLCCHAQRAGLDASGRFAISAAKRPAALFLRAGHVLVEQQFIAVWVSHHEVRWPVPSPKK
jgi:hypothetical protein